MGKFFGSAGAALPPRRDAVMVAAAAPAARPGDTIVIPEARDRLLDLIEREQLPHEVRTTLAGAMTGDLARQQLLFQAMIDTWPRLQKALREICLAARNAPWTVVPHAGRGEEPDAKAEALAKEVEFAVWGMRPDMVTGKKGFEGTVQEIAMGYFMGHYVGEIHWRQAGAPPDVPGNHATPGSWQPRCTKTAPPRYYGYPDWEEGEDRLMLDPEGGRFGSRNFVDFPEHRFLVAVNGGHPGHPTVAAPLRALAGYWMAAVFGLKWTMQYAQLFGIPFRWATYARGDTESRNAVVASLQTTGSQPWAAFPDGTNLNVVDSGKGASGLAQADLIKIADEQCDIFILGQSLTSSQGERGSQSLGEIHMKVREEVVAGVCDFVGEVLTHQLVPALVDLNYGDARPPGLPGIWAKFEAPKDEKGMAERDKMLGLLDGTFPVGDAFMRERHSIPAPAAGEKLFMEKPEPEEPEEPDGGKSESRKVGKSESRKEKVAASAATPGELVRQMEEMAESGLLDPDAAAAALAAAWIEGAVAVAAGGYDPNQPRDPGGEGGGQWIKEGGSTAMLDHPTHRSMTAEEARSLGWKKLFRTGQIDSLELGDGGLHFGSETQAREVYDGQKAQPRAYYVDLSNAVRMKDMGDWQDAQFQSQGFDPADVEVVVYLNRHEGLGEAGALDEEGYPLSPEGQDALSDEEFLKLNPKATDSYLLRNLQRFARAIDGVTKVEAGGWREIGGNPVYIENPRSSSPGDKSADSYRDPKKAASDSKSGEGKESPGKADSASVPPVPEKSEPDPAEPETSKTSEKMENGSEKQIAWATEMKESLIAQLKGNPTGTQVGSDLSMDSDARRFLVSYGTEKMERDERVAIKKARRERFANTTGAEFRAMAIVEMEKINDAQWWIENRSSDRSILALANIL